MADDKLSDEDDEIVPTVSSYSFDTDSSMNPRLDAMLKEIEGKLPSLDDEDSDFEDFSGDEVEIFQRPTGYGQLVMEDADKDLDESLTCSDLSDRWPWKPTTNVEEEDESIPNSNRSNDLQSWLNDSNRNEEANENGSADLESLMSDLNLSRITGAREAWPDENTRHSTPPLSPSTLPNTFHQSPLTSPRAVQSRTRSPRTQCARQSRPSRRDLARNSNAAMKLSLGSLENVDFDIALQTVVDDEFQRRQRSRSSSLDLFDLRPGDNALTSKDPNKCTELMQGLVNLSVKTTGEKLDIDPMSGADRSCTRHRHRPGRALSKYEADIVSEKGEKVKHTTSSGMSTDDSSAANYRVLAARPRSERLGKRKSPHTAKEPERDTVYIDLRKSEQALADERHRQAVVQRVLKLNDNEEESSDSSSDSSIEDGRDAWFEQRRRIRQALEKGETTPNPVEVRSKPISRKVHQPTHPVHMGSPTKKVCPPAPPPTEGSDGHAREEATPPQSAVEENAADSMEQETADERERMVEMEKWKQKAVDARKVIDAKLALREKLEKLRPTHSVDKKRNAALCTPLIYGLYSSHDQPLVSLPRNVDTRNDIIVLTVNLSSNERMTLKTQSAVVMDKIDIWSASYKALVSWLCSLVPNDIELEAVESDIEHMYPFQVVGMQQMVIDGNLVLAVAIAPTGVVDNNVLHAMRMNVKAFKKQSETLFARYMHKFLSLTTLVEVNPWLADYLSPAVDKTDASDCTYAQTNVQISSKPLSTFIQVQTNPDCVKQYFGAEIGFVWQTMNNEEQSYYTDDELPQAANDEHVETTLVLMSRQHYQSSTSVLTVLTRLFSEGLEVAGLRLASYSDSASESNKDGPVLGVAIRGTLAISRWLKQMGPADPELAKQVDNSCMMAVFGGVDRQDITLFTPRTPQLLDEHMSRWFGGRLTSDTEVILSGKALSHVEQTPSTEAADLDTFTRVAPVALLSATTTADCFVVVSTLVPTNFLCFILGLSHSRGFRLRGVRRRHLNQRQVSALGIPAESARCYLPTPDESACRMREFRDESAAFSGSRVVCYCHNCVPRPVTILHLSKENVTHHAAMMLEAVILHIIHRGLLDTLEKPDEVPVRSNFLHFTPFNRGLLNMLGREFVKVPESDSPATTSYIPPRLHSNAEMEQITFLAFVGNSMQAKVFANICELLYPEIKKCPGLELLGIKWLPLLSTSQAREMTPYEVGQAEWKGSIKVLTGNPVLALVLRGIDCTQRIKEVIYSAGELPGKVPVLDRIVTNTPELAYRLATLFFFDRELFADFMSRPNAKFSPPIRSAAKSTGDSWEEDGATTKMKRPKSGKGSRSASRTPPTTVPHREEESIYKTMLMGPRPLPTLLIVRPGVMAKQKLSKVLHSIMQEKFCIVGLRLVRLSEMQATCLQPPTIRKDEELHQRDVQHMTSGPCLLLALHRENSIKRLVKLLGPDNPKEAKELSPFFLRGIYGTDITSNGFYCSTSYPSAVSDIKQFFPDGLCCTETIDLTAEQILAPGVDNKLSAKGRVANERSIIDPGPYNLNRLNQVNCMVLLPPLVRLEDKSAKFADIIQCLQTSEVDIVGARMMWLTEEQAQHYLHAIKAGSFAQVPVLTSAPILVLAVQCHNAVLSFDYTMEEGMKKIGKSMEGYKLYMRSAKDVEMAKQLLAFFFDKLLGENCKLEISSRSDDAAQEKKAVSL